MKIKDLKEALAGKQEERANAIANAKELALADTTEVEEVRGALANVEALDSEIRSLKEDISAVEAIDALEAPEEEAHEEEAHEEPAPEAPEVPEVVEAEPAVEQEQEEAPEEQVEEARGINLMEIKNENKANVDFQAFLKSGETRDSLVTSDYGVIIPEDIFATYVQPIESQGLSALINRVNVKSSTGKIPVLAKGRSVLVTAEELAKNPELAKPVITAVPFDVKTYRGALPLSMEMLQDVNGIEALVSQYIADAKAQTEASKIAEVLAQATAVSATSVDDIKNAFNIGLSAYQKGFVVSESFFAWADTQKDGNGRYLLQDSITAPSGKSLLGAPVEIVPDTLLGKKAGDMVAFVGDAKAFVTEAVKSEIQLAWEVNDVFGKTLAIAIRADFVKADDQAGKFITVTIPKTA